MSSTWLEADHDIIGVDVSHWQVGPNNGHVNWALMAQNHPNLGFAMCKASQKTADSSLNTNLPAMKQQLSTVTRTFGNYTHPIAIGTYHFSNITSDKESDYVAQADMTFKEVIKTNVVPNFWVLDWEDENGNNVIAGTNGQKETFRAKMAKVFVIRLYNNLKNAFGSSYVPKIFIYLGFYFWGSPELNVVGNPYEWFGSYGPKLWIATYIDGLLPNTPPEQYHYDYAKLDPKLNIPHFEHDGHQWHAWQFTQTANIHGVKGKCDLSVARNSDVWHNDFYQSGPEPQSWPSAVSNPNFFNY